MIESGKYAARAVEVRLSESSKKKTPFVGVIFELTGDGPNKGERIGWQGYVTTETAERTIESLLHCGWDSDDLSVFGDGKLHGIDKNEVQLVVEMEPYGGDDPKYVGKSFPRVQWVNAKGGGAKLFGEAMNVAQAAAFGQKFKGLAMAIRAKSAKPGNGASTAEAKSDPEIPF